MTRRMSLQFERSGQINSCGRPDRRPSTNSYPKGPMEEGPRLDLLVGLNCVSYPAPEPRIHGPGLGGRIGGAGAGALVGVLGNQDYLLMSKTARSALYVTLLFLSQSLHIFVLVLYLSLVLYFVDCHQGR